MKYVLGLDLGESSLGWAMVELKNGEPVHLLDAGVRIFPAVVERGQGNAQPTIKNEERRAKRGARRVKRRRVARKTELAEILAGAGLLPKDERERQGVMAWDPYALRAKALNEKLAPFEIGRALYHLCQRRGFKSNRKEQDSKKDDAGKIKQAITELGAEMETAGARTLGEFLYRHSANKVALETGQTRVRNRYTGRAMYEHEFEEIWRAQKKHHDKLLSDDLKAAIHETIFFQYPFDIRERWKDQEMPSRANARRAPELANCTLIPSEKRCPAGSWIAQQFRLLKEINNLRVSVDHDLPRPLDDEERGKLIIALGRQREMKFSAIKKLLGLPKWSLFNLEGGKRNTLDGNTVEAALVGAFGEDAWEALTDEQRDRYRTVLGEETDDERFRAEAIKWNLPAEAVEKLVRFSPKAGHLRFSAKAMAALLPYLEKGIDEVTAIGLAHKKGDLPKSPDTEEQATLPKPPEVPNPNVMRCLHEVRKVVNALIREHGKPERVVVELARDLKQSGAERERATAQNRENEKLNREADAFFQGHERAKPTGTDRLKFRLWCEQGGLCIYSNQAIGAADLLAPNDIVEIDHILPYSRSLDDSYMNKILCFARANRDKGNRTPYEWKGGPDATAYQELVLRAQNAKLPKPKLERLQQEEIDTDEVVTRKLNDTRYASREAMAYLELLYPPAERFAKGMLPEESLDEFARRRRVLGSTGGLTAKCRRWWWGEEKSRDDHRHHALDAVMIACATPRHIKALADSFSRGEHGEHVKFDPPWPTFRDEVDHVIYTRERTWKLDGQEIVTKGLLVSHRPDKRLSGGFHEETNYGPTRNENEFAYRVSVTALTGPMLQKIRDKEIQRCVRAHLLAQGIAEPDKQTTRFSPKVWQTLPQLPVSERARRRNPELPAAIPIKRVRVTTVIEQPLLFNDKNGKPYRAVKTGSNHHMEIVETTDAKGRTKWEGVVVKMIDAARRARPGKGKTAQNVVQRDHGAGKRFVMSLAKDEMVMLKTVGAYELYRVQKMDIKGNVIFRPSTYAGLMKDTDKPPIIIRKTASSLQDNIVKVTVDPLGRLSVAHD